MHVYARLPPLDSTEEQPFLVNILPMQVCLWQKDRWHKGEIDDDALAWVMRMHAWDPQAFPRERKLIHVSPPIHPSRVTPHNDSFWLSAWRRPASLSFQTMNEGNISALHYKRRRKLKFQVFKMLANTTNIWKWSIISQGVSVRDAQREDLCPSHGEYHEEYTKNWRHLRGICITMRCA